MTGPSVVKGKLTPEQRQEIADKYENGGTLSGLAKLFGITKKSVKRLLKVRGVHIRPYVPQERTRRRIIQQHPPMHERWATTQAELAENRGDLLRPKFCQDCLIEVKIKKNGKPSIHAHHSDYNFPLQVTWLCPQCHKDWHSRHTPIPSKRKIDGKTKEAKETHKI